MVSMDGSPFRTLARAPKLNLVGVLNTDLESTQFQRSSAQISDSGRIVVRGFAETPTRLAPKPVSYNEYDCP
jgi:hypothetical protein